MAAYHTSKTASKIFGANRCSTFALTFDYEHPHTSISFCRSDRHHTVNLLAIDISVKVFSTQTVNFKRGTRLVLSRYGRRQHKSFESAIISCNETKTKTKLEAF